MKKNKITISFDKDEDAFKAIAEMKEDVVKDDREEQSVTLTDSDDGIHLQVHKLD